jgi:hypothetical protein
MPAMLTIRVRKKYIVVSEFEVPAYRFEGDGLASFLRAIYVASFTSDPQELIQYYINRRKGVPIRNSTLDLQNAWHPERREIGHCCGTPELLVSYGRNWCSGDLKVGSASG